MINAVLRQYFHDQSIRVTYAASNVPSQQLRCSKKFPAWPFAMRSLPEPPQETPHKSR
jgi:hypothetical protein